MIAVVRDERGVTHEAVRRAYRAGGIRWDTPDGVMVGALCEDTLENLLSGSFITWTTDEIGEGLPDCMSCLVRSVS